MFENRAIHCTLHLRKLMHHMTHSFPLFSAIFQQILLDVQIVDAIDSLARLFLCVINSVSTQLLRPL